MSTSKNLIFLTLSLIFQEKPLMVFVVVRRIARMTRTNIYIFGSPPNILSRVEAVEYIDKALQFAQHQEGITERDLRDLERIGHLFSRLQIDGRKQKKVDDYFGPKID